MSDMLHKRLELNGLVVQTFSITDFSFSPTFADAIENKTAAEQNVLTAQQTLEKAKIDNEQKVVAATADAQATMLHATAEANALKLQREQITPELVQLRQVEVSRAWVDVARTSLEHWNGVLPMVMSSTSPLMDSKAMQQSFDTQNAAAAKLAH